jgi:hypothetical protein
MPACDNVPPCIVTMAPQSFMTTLNCSKDEHQNHSIPEEITARCLPTSS